MPVKPTRTFTTVITSDIKNMGNGFKKLVDTNKWHRYYFFFFLKQYMQIYHRAYYLCLPFVL